MNKIISIVAFLTISVSTFAIEPILLKTKYCGIEVIVTGYNEEENIIYAGRNGEEYNISLDKFNCDTETWGEIWRLSKQNDIDKVFELGEKINKKSINKSAEEIAHDAFILSMLERETFVESESK